MFIIVSPRIGNPGDVFTPTEETNVQALLDAKLISTDTPKKPSKVKSETSEQE